MREVHRRAELARWMTLLALPVAVVMTVVATLAGAAAPNAAVLVAIAVAGVLVLMFHQVGGLRRYGCIPGDTIASSAATRRAVIARYAFMLVLTVVLIGALNGGSDLSWWILPWAWATYAISGAASWWFLLRWERRNPGATPVSDFG